MTKDEIHIIVHFTSPPCSPGTLGYEITKEGCYAPKFFKFFDIIDPEKSINTADYGIGIIGVMNYIDELKETYDVIIIESHGYLTGLHEQYSLALEEIHELEA